jgi:hypothetical protein
LRLFLVSAVLTRKLVVVRFDAQLPRQGAARIAHTGRPGGVPDREDVTLTRF